MGESVYPLKYQHLGLVTLFGYVCRILVFEIDIGGNPNLETSHFLREVMVLKNSSKGYRKQLKYIKSVKPRKMVLF
jgi:hypothetical protein